MRGDDGRTLTLPTETWREYVVRRERCLALRAKLSAGEVVEVNDLVTHNLDVRQFIQDAISTSEGPELLRAFHKATMRVTVLDPTCGSGAFLFAALNILEPVYEACLDRMRGFVDDLEGSSERHSPKKYEDFKRTLADVARHPSPSYFIFKSIIVNNLYGVDIMEEAVEICKLRLFLKLVSQVDRVGDLEPLPDIDFNVRAGNTLVGYVTVDEVRRAAEKVAMPTKADGTAIQSRMLDTEADTAIRAIEEEAEVVGRAYEQFHVMQSEHDMPAGAFAKAKVDLRGRLRALAGKLDRYLAREYGVDAADAAAFERWRKSHEPFHWVTEFYGIMRGGGFDVIVGNPPWAEYSTIRKTLTVRGYASESCGNLHCLCTERSLSLRGPLGRFSFIVQLPMLNSARMRPIRHLLQAQSAQLHVIPCDDRPGRLFEGLEHCRSVIFLSAAHSRSGKSKTYSTRYQRWFGSTRDTLFYLINYTPISGQSQVHGVLPKCDGMIHEELCCGLSAETGGIIDSLVSKRPTKEFVFYQEATQYWVKATFGLPYYAKNSVTGAPAHGRYLYCPNESTAHTLSALMNSTLFYIFFVTYGDCFHLSHAIASRFPLLDSCLADDALVQADAKLMSDLQSNASRKTISTRDGDVIEYDEYYGGRSKPIIDAIDTLLAAHYGFTDEELDFIINYDIKYRMGRDATTAEDVTT